MYDIIGDIHGHSEKLYALLGKLGYKQVDGVYSHPDRQVIFVGDFIDRGPDNPGVIEVAMKMVKSGKALAIMGNHEFNALAFAESDPDKPGQYLRPRNNKNIDQHIETLIQFKKQDHHPQGKDEALSWFWELPLFLDLPDLRVIHACWDRASIESIQPLLGTGNTLTKDLLVKASNNSTTEYKAIEKVLKGPEVTLPAGREFKDKDQNIRTQVRVAWWRDAAKNSFEEMVAGPKEAVEAARDTATPRMPVSCYPPTDKPVFFGHYWRKDEPSLLAPNIACVDYSAGGGGALVAYRHNGERNLIASNFVSSKSHL